MKNLKHIQIFEAFESKILSKTLGYIESNDRSTFMERLKRLCKSIDFPLSKMSDEYFEYLPFKSALNRAAMTGDEPCEATSKSEFPQYAVAGEKCTNGKIKRQWGARTRDVACPVCGGTGVKPKKSEIKLVKFWFTAEGKFVAITLVDGMIRTSRSRTPRSEDEVNPYSWNVGLDFSYSGMRANTSTDVQSAIKDAHFAIVFDFGKLRKSDFETTQDTRDSREERKEGSKLDPNQSDESIKKKNIERYVNLLSQRLDISSDIANCNRLITRSLGHKSALYIVYGTNIYSYLGDIISYYIKFMSATDDRERKNYAEAISDKTNDMFRNGMRRGATADQALKDLKIKLKDNNKDERYFEVLDLNQKLSDAIYNSIKNYQISDIEDLEIVAQKISSIRNILKSDRYGLNNYFSYVVDYLASGRPDRAYSHITDNYYCNLDRLLTNLPRVTSIVSKI